MHTFLSYIVDYGIIHFIIAAVMGKKLSQKIKIIAGNYVCTLQ